MKKFILATLFVLCGIFIGMLMMICIFTPEKTKYGEYTSPYLYWTNDAYFQKNFK